MLTDLPINISALPGIITPADRYLAMLRSRNVREAVIRKLDLQKYFHISIMSDALLQLDNITYFDKTEEDLIVIQATEKTPEMAQRIVQAFVEELDRVNRQTRVTSAHNTRIFLEKRIQEVEKQLKDSAERIRDFQLKYKAISIEEQTKASIEAAANLRAEIALNEVKLGLLERNRETTHPQVESLKFQLVELKNQLKKLETGAGLDDSEYVIPFQKIPDLSKEYVFLTKDLEVFKAIYTLLTQQYEQAKIQEKKDTPTLQILDSPNLPDKRSKPQRRLIVLLAFLLSVVVSLFIVFFVEYIRKLRSVEPDRYQKLVEAWDNLLGSFRFRKKNVDD